MTQDNMLAIKTTVAAVIAMLTALWGWFGWLVIAWVFLMAAVYWLGHAITSGLENGNETD